jgi:hypothetical protein
MSSWRDTLDGSADKKKKKKKKKEEEPPKATGLHQYIAPPPAPKPPEDSGIPPQSFDEEVVELPPETVHEVREKLNNIIQPTPSEPESTVATPPKAAMDLIPVQKALETISKIKYPYLPVAIKTFTKLLSSNKLPEWDETPTFVPGLNSDSLRTTLNLLYHRGSTRGEEGRIPQMILHILKIMLGNIDPRMAIPLILSYLNYFGKIEKDFFPAATAWEEEQSKSSKSKRISKP